MCSGQEEDSRGTVLCSGQEEEENDKCQHLYVEASDLSSSSVDRVHETHPAEEADSKEKREAGV